MGTTTTYKWRYPEPSHTPDVPRDIKALAEDAEATVKKLGIKAAAVGSVTVAVTANTVTSHTVTFPAGRFTAAPVVLVTPVTTGPQSIFGSPGSVTATGFTLYAYRATYSGTVTFQWFAALGA